ncbi:uncharacterized protein [Pithys albifrons albifrons]|uniref:uncharacterized protein isoform X6 n=1 Tax=Pithys albifrons albifrons TaxID=3385563 RepID=UPI003A5CB01D
MGSEAGPLLATAPPCGKGPATHRHAAGPVSESLQATGKAALEPLGRAQLTADTSRRGCSCSVQTMLGQGGCDKLSPACLAFLLLLLLLLGAGVMAQDICNSPGDGDLPAPELFMSLSAAEEGEQVLFRCQLFVKSPDTRIVFCKDGVQVKSLKAQQKTGTYYMLFFMTRSNAGIYTCGYQHKNSSQVRNSALSAPQNLSVTGSRSSSQAETSTEGACRERCQSNDTNGFMKFWTQMPKPFPQSLCRQQQVLTQESEVMDDSEIESLCARAEQQHSLCPGEGLLQPVQGALQHGQCPGRIAHTIPHNTRFADIPAAPSTFVPMNLPCAKPLAHLHQFLLE